MGERYIIGLVAFIFGYRMFGVANSMVYTIAIQGGPILIVAVALLVSGYEYFAGGIKGFLGKLSDIDAVFVQ